MRWFAPWERKKESGSSIYFSLLFQSLLLPPSLPSDICEAPARVPNTIIVGCCRQQEHKCKHVESLDQGCPFLLFWQPHQVKLLLRRPGHNFKGLSQCNYIINFCAHTHLAPLLSTPHGRSFAQCCCTSSAIFHRFECEVFWGRARQLNVE